MNELLSRIEELKNTGIEAMKQFPDIKEVTMREKWHVLYQMEGIAIRNGQHLSLLPNSGKHCLILTYPNEGITISIIHEQKK